MGKNPPANAVEAGDVSLIPGLGRSSGEGNSNPLQYPYLENLMDRGAWWTIVHRVARDGHNLATKPPPQCYYANNSLIKNSAVTGLPWWLRQ